MKNLADAVERQGLEILSAVATASIILSLPSCQGNDAAMIVQEIHIREPLRERLNGNE